MKQFEVDVSGSDILSRNYTIVLAENKLNGLIIGFKFNSKIQQTLLSRFGANQYDYNKSKKGMAYFRIRLYCIVIYQLFKILKQKYSINNFYVDFCRDFQGNENNINQQLDFFLKNKLNLDFEHRYVKLSKNSIADKYAFLIRNDDLNKLKSICIEISITMFEKYLK